MTPDDLYASALDAYSTNRRTFALGLMVAMIDMCVALGTPGTGISSFDELIALYPIQATTQQGKIANTLIVEGPSGKIVSLRPHYNHVEKLFRATHKRFGYPSSAPHATQAWSDYRHWMGALAALEAHELASLRQRLIQFVLDNFESHEFDPSTVDLEPPLFSLILEHFELSGAPTGAPFQGIVFGFLRADNPHLQFEIDKVRTGSKRLQRVGDIDGWEGERLALSAEVKQLTATPDTVADIPEFVGQVSRRGALGILAALRFTHEGREAAESSGLVAVDKSDMLRIVRLWDPIKQRIAATSFQYYAAHVEKSADLTQRIAAFLDESARAWLDGRRGGVASAESDTAEVSDSCE